MKIRVGRRTVDQSVYIARNFSRDLLLGDDAVANLQINNSTYPRRAVTISGHGFLGRVLKGCEVVCYLSSPDAVSIQARHAADVLFHLPQGVCGEPEIQEGDLVMVEQLQEPGQYTDLMIPRSLTRVENGNVTVPVINPQQVDAKVPVNSPLVRMEKITPSIVAIEEIVPRVIDQPPIVVTPEMRRELVEKLRQKLNHGKPIPAIPPGLSLEHADLTEEEKELFMMALQTVRYVFASSDLSICF